ncbi:uncharacterized protein N7459_007981 [Penicillium hispanicum]|uniref:uncharacterized protein n=1 Tax=Penicillium hispanicum TaxID=1080232 RepID=UPI0025423F2C|nr:uncharacterized protein N7459_007981 [Penicillium hispanicum]KAJ5573554.1 hypothetical protein N7459_007981 [Penicillium hispanicum]
MLSINTNITYPPTTGDTSQGALNRGSTCSESNRTCTPSILHALQNLCIPPSVCLSVGDDSFPSPHEPAPNTQSGHSRKMDDALTTNRKVIELVSHVLCCPCSGTPSVQLLLVVLCDRVVAWYRAMANSGNDEPFTAAPGPFSVPTSSAADDDEQGERILAQPVTIGEFAMDPAMQMRIQDQLVIGELRRVECMIQQFAARVQETRTQSSSGQGQKIYEMLGGLLRDQLQTQVNITRRRMETR